MGGSNARNQILKNYYGGDSDLWYKKRESLEKFIPRTSIVFNRLKVFLVILKTIGTDSCIQTDPYVAF
jgi:hypothetical protein